MTFDPVLLSDVRAWLIKASRDLRSAELALQAEAELYGDVVFHCQQAAEKSLKAFLVWHDTRFRKTHSLEEIGEQCLAVDSTLKLTVDRAVPLTQYAWKFRYPPEPGEPDEPTREEAQRALEIAREVWNAILGRLPREAHPEP